jgi:hypothetical protein
MPEPHSGAEGRAEQIAPFIRQQSTRIDFVINLKTGCSASRCRRRYCHVPRPALDAEPFANAAVVARHTSELIEIDGLAKGQAPFQLFKLAAQGGARTDQAELKLGQRGRPAQVIGIQRSEIAPASRP